MADRDLASRSEKTVGSSDCCCRVANPSSSLAETDKSWMVWRRYCALALVLSTLSVLLCAVTWSENASVHRRLLAVEERLKNSLALDDPQFDTKMGTLLDNKMMLFATNADLAGSSQARSRSIRQVTSATAAPAECLCPPGTIPHLSVLNNLFSDSLRPSPFLP